MEKKSEDVRFGFLNLWMVLLVFAAAELLDVCFYWGLSRVFMLFIAMQRAAAVPVSRLGVSFGV